jgi:lysozyme family protein
MNPITSYDDAFTALMGNEGSYSNNPADPGGETMWGITLRVARANGYTGAMRNLPQSTAKAIAKSEYWDKIHGDSFPPQIAFQMFDAIYNGGRPAQWIQQAAGITVDGAIGPATIAAVKAADPDKIIMRFDAYRLQYLAALPTRATFAGGWMNRIANNLLMGAA